MASQNPWEPKQHAVGGCVSDAGPVMDHFCLSYFHALYSLIING